MHTMTMTQIAKFLSLSKTSKTSILIRSKPGRGVIAAIIKEYPDIVRITASMSDVHTNDDLVAIIRENHGNPILLDLDVPECVIAYPLNTCLIDHIADDGKVIIVCNGTVTLSPPMRNRLVALAVE